MGKSEGEKIVGLYIIHIHTKTLNAFNLYHLFMKRTIVFSAVICFLFVINGVEILTKGQSSHNSVHNQWLFKGEDKEKLGDGYFFRITFHESNDTCPSIFQTSDERIWIFWSSDRGGEHEVYYRISEDGGVLWTEPKRLAEIDYAPILFESSDGKLFTYYLKDKKLMYKYIGRNENSWSKEKIAVVHEMEFFVSTITRDNKFWVFWDEGYYISTEDGCNFSSKKQITDVNINDIDDIIQMEDGRFLAVSRRFIDDDTDGIFYRIFDKNKSSEEKEALLGYYMDFSNLNLVQTIDGEIILIYLIHERGKNNIYRASYDQKNQTWDKTFYNFSSHVGNFYQWNDYNPYAYISRSGDFWVVWQREKDGNNDIWAYKETMEVVDEEDYKEEPTKSLQEEEESEKKPEEGLNTVDEIIKAYTKGKEKSEKICKVVIESEFNVNKYLIIRFYDPSEDEYYSLYNWDHLVTSSSEVSFKNSEIKYQKGEICVNDYLYEGILIINVTNPQKPIVFNIDDEDLLRKILRTYIIYSVANSIAEGYTTTFISDDAQKDTHSSIKEAANDARWVAAAPVNVLEETIKYQRRLEFVLDGICNASVIELPTEDLIEIAEEIAGEKIENKWKERAIQLSKFTLIEKEKIEELERIRIKAVEIGVSQYVINALDSEIEFRRDILGAVRKNFLDLVVDESFDLAFDYLTDKVLPGIVNWLVVHEILPHATLAFIQTATSIYQLSQIIILALGVNPGEMYDAIRDADAALHVAEEYDKILSSLASDVVGKNEIYLDEANLIRSVLFGENYAISLTYLKTGKMMEASGPLAIIREIFLGESYQYLLDWGKCIGDNESEWDEKALKRLINITRDRMGNASEFSLGSPADLHVYDLKGRHIGLNYETGEIEKEIPNALYLENDSIKKIIIPFLDGNYRIELIGTGSGEYHLTVTEPIIIENPDGTTSRRRVVIPIVGDISGGQTQNFSYNMNQIASQVSQEMTRIIQKRGLTNIDDTTRKEIIEEAIQNVVNRIDSDRDGTPDVEDRTPVLNKAQWSDFFGINATYLLIGIFAIVITTLIGLKHVRTNRRKSTLTHFEERKVAFSNGMLDQGRQNIRKSSVRNEFPHDIPIKERKHLTKGKIITEYPVQKRKIIKKVNMCGDCPYYVRKNNKYGFCSMKKWSLVKTHLACDWMKDKEYESLVREELIHETSAKKEFTSKKITMCHECLKFRRITEKIGYCELYNIRISSNHLVCRNIDIPD